MTGTSAFTPLRASSSARKPMRCTLVCRSSRLNPRPAEMNSRISSPSSTSTRWPSSRSRPASSYAMVVLPALGRPVSQTVAPVVTWFSWFGGISVMSAVQPALGLATARPAPGAGVLALKDAAGAGRAAHGRVTVHQQRVGEDPVLCDVRVHVVLRPAGDRRDLDLAALLVPVDDRGVRAGR